MPRITCSSSYSYCPHDCIYEDGFYVRCATYSEAQQVKRVIPLAVGLSIGFIFLFILVILGYRRRRAHVIKTTTHVSNAPVVATPIAPAPAVYVKTAPPQYYY